VLLCLVFIQAVIGKLTGFAGPAAPIADKGSKTSRAHAVAPLMEAGQVRFARKADSLVEELLAFSPRGGIDDQVDAFCQGVLWIEAQYWRSRGHSSAPLPMVFSR